MAGVLMDAPNSAPADQSARNVDPRIRLSHLVHAPPNRIPSTRTPTRTKKMPYATWMSVHGSNAIPMVRTDSCTSHLFRQLNHAALSHYIFATGVYFIATTDHLPTPSSRFRQPWRSWRLMIRIFSCLSYPTDRLTDDGFPLRQKSNATLPCAPQSFNLPTITPGSHELPISLSYPHPLLPLSLFSH